MSDVSEVSEAGFHILLVEDQVRHRRVYQEAITESLPVTVSFAATGEEARAALAAPEPPDLVVLDLEIPGTRGEDLLAHIRGDHRLRYIPVIILTGLGGQDKQTELLELGADDFIEKGGPPSVLIARLKAQMRHKLAIDRLERLALDRDLFAAGVLQDIGASKGTIVSLCRSAKEALARGPKAAVPEILTTLAKLSSHAEKLGAYASDVIQSVRETHRAPVLAAQAVEPLLDWACEVLATAASDTEATGGTQTGSPVSPISWKSASALRPVLADKSFLRLALLNVVQHAQASGGGRLQVSQEEHDDAADPRGRRFVVTRLRDSGPRLAERELTQLFQPTFQEDGGAGMSLGLTLVAKVMARMGGRAWAEAPADGGEGTVLCLDLPAG